MKLIKIILFILLVFQLNCNAQKKDGWKVASLYTTSIVFNSIGDAWLADNNKPILAHSFKAGSIACLLSIPFVTEIKKDKWYLYVISYTTIRIGLFDPIYNISRGLLINQTHTVTLWDKSIKYLTGNNNLGYLGRGVFFVVGFSIPINQGL